MFSLFMLVWFFNQLSIGVPFPQITPSQNWQQIPGNASCLSISIDGNVWCVGSSNTIWQWGSSNTWEQFSGNAKSIALGASQGFVWNINASGTITYRLGSWGAGLWSSIPDSVGRVFKQVVCGSSGQAWCVDDAGNIFFREGVTRTNPLGTGWKSIDGSLSQISVGKDDQVWGVNSNGFVYTRLGVSSPARAGTVWLYVQTPVTFKHVSVGLDGSVWGVGTDKNVYFRKYTWAYTDGSSAYGNNMDWELVDNPQGIAFAQVIAGRDGEVCALDSSGKIWYRYYRTPLLVSGKKVVIVSYKNINSPKLLTVTNGKYLSPTGTNVNDAASQFTMLNLTAGVSESDIRTWVGFKSATASNNNLQSVATADTDPLYAVRFGCLNFADVSHSWEHWTVIPLSAKGHVALLNQGTNGFLSVPDSTASWNALSRVWTTYNGTNRAGESGPGWWERFKIMTPEEATAAGLFTSALVVASAASIGKLTDTGLSTVQVTNVQPVSVSALTSISDATVATTSATVAQKTTSTLQNTTIYDSATPPGGEKFKLIGMDGVSLILTSFGWVLPTIGNGVITFKANAASDIWVVLGKPSDVDSSQPVQCIAVGIGVDGNTKSVIRTTIDSENKVSRADTIAQGRAGISDSWGDYWVMVRNGTIMYGKGATPGKNQILQWSDPIIKTVNFVGFGCKGKTTVELDNIKIIKAPSVTKEKTISQVEKKEKTKTTQTILLHGKERTVTKKTVVARPVVEEKETAPVVLKKKEVVKKSIVRKGTTD